MTNAIFWIILIAIGLLVLWRLLSKPAEKKEQPDSYVCTDCNETQCDCHKEEKE